MRMLASVIVICIGLFSNIRAQAGCSCYCINGSMQPICQNPTDLPPVCPPRNCSAPIAPPPPQAVTPPQLSPTAQHAAYCAGVLGVIVPPKLSAVEGDPIAPKTKALKAIEVEGPDGKVHTFPTGTSNAEITVKMTEIYGAKKPGTLVMPAAPFLAGDKRNLRQRHRRYDDYLERELIHFAMMSGHIGTVPMAELASIRDQGADEAQSSANDFHNPMYSACEIKCHIEPKCLVDCIDAYSVTAAKVLGCQILPDGLPY